MLTAASSLLLIALAAPTDVDFAREVAPLLEARCQRCHGAEKQRGGLRLDSRAAALLGGDSGAPAIAPGEPGESQILARLRPEYEEDRMPPKGEPLSDQEVALLRRWIAEGASWGAVADASRASSDHWAYRTPERPPLPEVEDGGWCRNPIDRFVLARLEAEGLAPSPEAELATLVRRVHLDLLGLPPPPERVDSLRRLAADDPGAWEQLLDELFASPHHAEREARLWMDLARYADSHGYTFDDARPMWRWRDELIRAFERDQPFDAFTLEQLAGDLLPDATLEQRIASAFHRNTMVNQEGGADDEEFRVAAVIDRVNTTATVWLGSTLECAQCHSHKYDPFTQRDYYRLYAFFNDTADGGVSAGPSIVAPTPQDRRARERIERELRALRAELTASAPALAGARADWLRRERAALAAWRPVVPEAARAGAALDVHPDGTVIAREGPPADDYVLELPVGPGRVTALRLEVLADDSLPHGGPGRADNGNFVLSELRLELRGSEGEARPLALANARADFSQHRSDASHWPVEHAIDGDDATGWAILPQAGRDHEAVFALAEPLAPDAPATLRVTLAQRYGRAHTIGRLRLALTDAEPAPPSSVPGELRALLARPERELTADEGARLHELWADQAPELERTRAEIARLEASRRDVPRVLVMRELDEPRETHVLLRGSFLDPGPVVGPGVPEVLPPLPVLDHRPNRLDLARWLVAPENPLTARVVVNREWQRFFGRGLVETENDFGTRGAPPSHPALLDWLAVELAEHGWDRRRVQRLILDSATWRQSSRATSELRARDPRNRLFARQSRPRLDAEQIRDSALYSSGLLSTARFGPPVHPPQPAGVFAFTQKPKPWPVAAGPDRYRRTLYTKLWRSSLHPFLATFDVPPGDRTCTRRGRSNTPLQALAMANDPMFVELARGLAARVLAEEHADERARLVRAFRLCVARQPGARELELLERFLAEQRRSFAADPDAALALAPEGVAPARGAAWTATARVLFNLDEFLTRE